MPHVQPDLMVATCMGDAPHQTQAGGIIARNRIIEFAALQRLKFGLRLFQRSLHSLWKWFGDAAFMVHVSTDECQVFFGRATRFKLCFTRLDGRGVLAKKNHTARGFVEAVNRVQTPGIVVPQDVAKVLVFVCVDGGFVHQQTRRFEDRQVAVVFEKQPNLSVAR